MAYSEIPPNSSGWVTVEWLDITGSHSDPGLTRRWTVGKVLSSTFVSEGVECVVLGTTWDEDGWSDFSTFPKAIIVSQEKL